MRDLCLALPEVEEFQSHGMTTYRAGKNRATKEKVFAMLAINHHGDGRVGLWLATPAMEQSRLLASAPRHLYKPQYVGPAGWIGVELNRGISWKRVCELVHMAYLNCTKPKIAALAPKPVVVPAPTVKMKPEEIDRLKAPKALKTLARMRKLCLALPETGEGVSFGSPLWRVGKKSFAMLYDFGEGLKAQFWVGIERQGPLGMDPRFSVPAYMGHNGWMALDMNESVSELELRDLILDSYRHFATARALRALDAQS